MFWRERVAEQLILVAGAGAAALDGEPLPGRHEGGVALLLVAAEEGGDRHMQRARQRLQRVERGRGHAVLDLREHAGGEIGERARDRPRSCRASCANSRTSRPMATSSRAARSADEPVRVLEFGRVRLQARNGLRCGAARAACVEPIDRRSSSAVTRQFPQGGPPDGRTVELRHGIEQAVQRYSAEALSASR